MGELKRRSTVQDDLLAGGAGRKGLAGNAATDG